MNSYIIQDLLLIFAQFKLALKLIIKLVLTEIALIENLTCLCFLIVGDVNSKIMIISNGFL